MSTQTDKIRQKKCPECKKRIDLPNFDLHFNRCIEARSQLSSNSSMSNVSLQNGERTKGKRKTPQAIQYFLCHLCGHRQTMLELDTHPNVCLNKEINCPICHINFPTNIFPDHRFACNRQNQAHRQSPTSSRPVQGISNSVHSIVRNNQDKQLVVNKQTYQQTFFRIGNQPTNNQIDYTMNLPPVPKPEIFPHQQNFQITQNTNNTQTHPHKKAEIKKGDEKVVNNTGLNQQKMGQAGLNKQQAKSISQKLEKSTIAEVDKKSSVSQVLPNTKSQATKNNQPITNNVTNAPKHINPFKNKESATINPFIGQQHQVNSLNSSNVNSQKNVQPVRYNTNPKQNPVNTTSIKPSINNNIPKNIQNTLPSNNSPPKINQVIPSNNTNRNNIIHTQTSSINPSHSNQNVPRSNRPNPAVNPFKNNVDSNQTANLFVPSRNPTSTPPPSSTTNNISSSNGSSSLNTSSSFSSTDSSFYILPHRQDNPRERVPNEPLETRDLIRGINQYFSDMNLDRFRRMLQDRTLIEFLSFRLSDGKSGGLPDNSIRTIPEILFTTQMTKGETESCSICFVQFQKNDKLKNLRCRHLYHSKCIGDWLKINRLCPLCKTDLSENIPPEFRQVSREDRLMQIYLRTVIATLPDSDEDDDDYVGFN